MVCTLTDFGAKDEGGGDTLVMTVDHFKPEPIDGRLYPGARAASAGGALRSESGGVGGGLSIYNHTVCSLSSPILIGRGSTTLRNPIRLLGSRSRSCCINNEKDFF